ncbi:hypothetical protein BH10ACT7_BH10ACT7_17060 [soil metagenome]
MSHENAAGSSARREYERRRAKDEARLRADWGPLGGVAVALSGERQSTRAWATGAAGEERLGALLDGLRSEGSRTLHDRRIPGSRANIDHMVVTPGGVWIVDAKRYKGRPELRIEGGLLRPRAGKLYVGGRDKTALVDGVEWQLARVAQLLGEVPLYGVLCFVDADWPLFGGAFQVRAVEVLWPRKLMARVRAAESQLLDVEAVAAQLTSAFRPA